MWKINCDMPTSFAERVNSVFSHLDDHMLDDRNQERTLALRKALEESCRLLEELNEKTFAEDIVAILASGEVPHRPDAPPEEFYRFLDAEAMIMKEAGFSMVSVMRIEQLIVECRHLQTGWVRPAHEVVDGLRELRDRICERSRYNTAHAGRSRIAKRLAWGVGGVGLAGANMWCGAGRSDSLLVSASVGAGVDMLWNAIR